MKSRTLAKLPPERLHPAMLNADAKLEAQIVSWKIRDISMLVRGVKDSTRIPTESTTLRAHRACTDKQ